MIGIKNIGVYIPEERISNIDKPQHAAVTTEFLTDKVGINKVSRKGKEEKTSDLCVAAVKNLMKREPSLDLKTIDFICVCTQNGDYSLPQTSAIVHEKLEMSDACASFDISLGCSGYVYSILVAKSFMEANGLKKGLVITADPYSEIVDPNDKNTDLIFGDGAAATLMTDDPVYSIGKGAFYTDGTNHTKLIRYPEKALYMSGRSVFNFAIRNVPNNIRQSLANNETEISDVDLFILHQGSKFIVDNLVERMELDPEKVPFAMQEYGNTVSSSIPIILCDHMDNPNNKKILISGFGVGLSIASTVLKKIIDN